LIKFDNIEPYNFTKFYLQGKSGDVVNTPLSTFVDNFYMVDPISRASPVMA